MFTLLAGHVPLHVPPLQAIEIYVPLAQSSRSLSPLVCFATKRRNLKPGHLTHEDMGRMCWLGVKIDS